jgi:uncharacterized cupredoxin-like copper-binding protein
MPARAGFFSAGTLKRRSMSSTEQTNDRRALADRTERTRGDVTNQQSVARIERELVKHARSIRRTQQGFVIFATLALLIALGNLVTTALKLGTKDVRVKTAGAAVPASRAGAKGAKAATPTVPGHNVSVSLKEFKVLPAASQAAAGKVAFHVRNAGTVKHEFVVIRTNKQAADLLKGSRADETGKVGEIDGLNRGQSGKLSLHLKPGHYALICNQPGHYKAGQHVDFTVR